MATAPENRRTDSIRVRLSPEMMERFERLASCYGMPPATLCAFAVARFVQQEDTNAQLARMAVMGATRKAGDRMEEVLSDASLEKMIPGVLAELASHHPDLAKALQQKSLPLDGEAPEEGA